MSTLNLKTLTFGVILSQMAIIISSQTVFATDIPKGKTTSAEVVYEDGKCGLERVPLPNTKLQLKKVSNLEIHEIKKKHPKVLVYAAYTSYTESRENDTYWPWVYPDEAYLYVAFKVTQSTKVKIRWKVKGASELKYNLEFEDPLEEGGLLSPDYWYYAWLQPDSLELGLHECKVRIKPVKENGKKWGKGGKDSCEFDVLEEE